MRKQDFPFEMYRDWSETPEVQPDLDTHDLIELSEWHRIYRRPIVDDLSDAHNFYPSFNGAVTYVQRAASKNFAGKTALSEHISEDEFVGRMQRAPAHIAQNTEVKLASYWTVARIRAQAIEEALRTINDRQVVDESVVAYASDAITDYGHCLRFPSDKTIVNGKKVDYGSGLRTQIERVAPGAADAIEGFGMYAGEHPEVLASADGVRLLQMALQEQERRISHWKPRYEAIVEAYEGDIEVSEDILDERVPFEELLKLTSH